MDYIGVILRLPDNDLGYGVQEDCPAGLCAAVAVNKAALKGIVVGARTEEVTAKQHQVRLLEVHTKTLGALQLCHHHTGFLQNGFFLRRYRMPPAFMEMHMFWVSRPR